MDDSDIDRLRDSAKLFREIDNHEITVPPAVAAPFGVEDLALGILAVSEGLVPAILSALGVSRPTLSSAILDRYHPAS